MTEPYTIVSLTLPRQLVDDAQEKLIEQGSSLETFVRLQLTAFKRSKVSLRLKDQITFGKYYGEKVEDIVRADLRYMAYLLEQPDLMSRFHVEVARLVNQLASAE